MEQFMFESKKYWSEIRKAFRHFTPSYLYIREMGSRGGKVIVNEPLEGKRLTVTRSEKGLYFHVDGTERFFYSFEHCNDEFALGKTWFITHERQYPPTPKSPKGIPYLPSQVYLEPPDDPMLPPIARSVLRSANGDYLIEIEFMGKIPLKKTRPMYGHTTLHFFFTIFVKKGEKNEKPRKK